LFGHLLVTASIGKIDRRLRRLMTEKKLGEENLPRYAARELLDLSLSATQLAQAWEALEEAKSDLGRRVEERTEKYQLAKEEAEKANLAKSEFLASMSHDLRTPLNAIMGFAEMMEARAFGPLGDPHYEEYAKDIHGSGNLLVSLIDDILDISKIEAGKYELDEKTLDVSLLVQSSVKMISTLLEAGKLHLATDMEPNLPMLRGDEKAITQILNNLLSNAVKFTPADGKVTVSAKLDGDGSINVLVADTGEGMSSHDIIKALNPFEQADSAHARRHEGTGLGLYLCQKFIELHDGGIKLQSKVGKGTTVTMRFPPERTVAS
ncbi:MAG: HAMP domain-containing sensor histidine kinase, partial [Rhodospirillales bacterium]|nr:HAMP domain-containing sensor histidine kinase [Rhodospirillales bacterium]